MTGGDPYPEPLPVAAGAAVLGGVASVWEPYFLGLCLAASSLAAIAWLLGPAAPGRGPARPGTARHLTGGLLVAGWGATLAGGPYLGRFAALPLAVTTGALWFGHRTGRRPSGRGP